MKVNIGKGHEMDVDTSKLPANVVERVLYIGLRNILMDAHASITRAEYKDQTEALSWAASEKKLAAMYNGEVRVTGTREGDPVKAEAIRLATNAIRAKIRKAGKKLSDYDPKAIRAKAVTLIDKFRAQAEKNVANMPQTDIDLSDLVS